MGKIMENNIRLPEKKKEIRLKGRNTNSRGTGQEGKRNKKKYYITKKKTTSRTEMIKIVTKHHSASLHRDRLLLSDSGHASNERLQNVVDAAESPAGENLLRQIEAETV